MEVRSGEREGEGVGVGGKKEGGGEGERGEWAERWAGVRHGRSEEGGKEGGVERRRNKGGA